jgi:sugar phosphate isomerase/epimerase
MFTSSRRTFLATGAAFAVSSAFVGKRAFATPLGLPLGIQLYSVRDQMKVDLDEALAAIHSAGFVEVEAAALPKKSAKEIRAALDKAGLRCVSAHHPYGELAAGFEEKVAFDKELGVKFMICSSPGFRNPAPAGSAARSMTLDDWKFNAEEFNKFGEKTAASGVMFGYHNHVHEFSLTEGSTPYDVLLKSTDPKKVTFELDCGWAKVAGRDPVELMKANPHRFSMLHVKDFTLPSNPSPDNHDAKVTELGRGSIDYRPVFAQAAKNQQIKHAFVEQEAFDIPWKDSLKVDADYLRGLKQ